MKIITTGLLAFTFSLVLSAQNFPTSDAWWHDAFVGFIGAPLSQFHYLCGDTIIGGVAYQQLYTASSDLEGNITAGSYNTAIRSAGEQVYVYDDLIDGEFLLYDFSLEAGDTILLDSDWGVAQERVVLETYFQDIEGDIRKFIVFEPLWNAFQEVWIEGIGSNLGLLDRALPLVDDYEPFAVCFMSDNDGIYYVWPQQAYLSMDCQLPDAAAQLNCPDITDAVAKTKVKADVSILPNPVSHTLYIHHQNYSPQKYTLEVYSIAGLKILQKTLDQENTALDVSHLPEGQYFIRVYGEKGKVIYIDKFIIACKSN